LVTRGAARTEKFLSAPRIAEALTALNDTARRADQGLQQAVDEINDSTEEVLGHAALYRWRLRQQISRRTTAAASTVVDRWLPRPSRDTPGDQPGSKPGPSASDDRGDNAGDNADGGAGGAATGGYRVG
jgi:hypothetical protein